MEQEGYTDQANQMAARLARNPERFCDQLLQSLDADKQNPSTIILIREMDCIYSARFPTQSVRPCLPLALPKSHKKPDRERLRIVGDIQSALRLLALGT